MSTCRARRPRATTLKRAGFVQDLLLCGVRPHELDTRHLPFRLEHQVEDVLQLVIPARCTDVSGEQQYRGFEIRHALQQLGVDLVRVALGQRHGSV